MNSLKGFVKEGKLSWNVFTQLRLSIRNNSTNAEIKIPNRIERGATDILKALESTIHRDPTSMPYSFIDDPFLLPYSNHTKRTYALSLESGRKAAIWIREKHSDLFQHREADPTIQSFIPKAIYTEKSEVSEEVLLNAIKQAQVEDARHIYGLLDNDVSDQAKLSLLELLCYYNNNQPTDTEFLEEKWLSQLQDKRQFWVMDTDVDNLFAYLSNSKDKKIVASAYNAMIAACGKYYRIDLAQSLKEQCKENGYPLNVIAYNNLIQLIVAQTPDIKVRQETVFKRLSEMHQDHVRPNVQTMNACLSVMSEQFCDQSYNFVTTILNEFKRLDIHPCLTTYYHIVHMFRKAPGKIGNEILHEIVNDLEAIGELQAQDLKDTFFFTAAMSMARYTFDLNLAQRIHNILLSNNNYKFIGDQYKENLYYRHYTLLFLITMPIERFMEVYQNLVPNVYIPEPKVIEEILNTMAINPPSEIANMLPMIWSQLVMFNLTRQRNVINKFFDVLLSVSTSLPDDQNLIKEHGTIAWKYFELLDERVKASKRMETVEGSVLGKVLNLLMINRMHEEVVQVFKFVNVYENIIADLIPPEDLVVLMQKCVAEKFVDVAFYILEYSIRCGYYESKVLGEQIGSLPLTPKETRLLTGLLGDASTEEPKQRTRKSEEIQED